MNTFMNGLKNATNFTYTDNGALAHKSTGSKLFDLFALGGAYRQRSNADCINLFMNAFNENEEYAMKCLFYLRDARGGQGERRFYRVCMGYLAQKHPEAVRRNLQYIPEFGRWDDLFCLFGTSLEDDVLTMIKSQLALDIQSKTPSLLAKWLPSENTSSAATRTFGNKIRTYLGLSHKGYRKMLSAMRERIKVLEKLMSANRWEEIEFDKIPSKAGLIYRNAFARRDVIKAKYEAFANDETAKVNADTLYPYEVVEKALQCRGRTVDSAERKMVTKYWENMKGVDAPLNALAVVDTSGSMRGRPINVAISLGLFCADKARGPFAGHYISFASRPQLIETTGIDIVDKVDRIYRTNLVDDTNLEAAFRLILNTAITNKCKQEDLPETLIVISDMQINYMSYWSSDEEVLTGMETLHKEWAAHGYQMPKLVYWNVNASNDTILDLSDNVSYVSGCSPSILDSIMQGKTQKDLMWDVLNKDRYKEIK